MKPDQTEVEALRLRVQRLESVVDAIGWLTVHESAQEIYDVSIAGPADVVSVKSVQVMLDGIDPAWRERIAPAKTP